MNRRAVFGLCALPLVGVPFKWSGVQTVSTSAEARSIQDSAQVGSETDL
jgi:hypothetical protein